MSNYFEDLQIGPEVRLGSHTFTSEEIIDFARRFDPQPFHLDPVAARDSLFGGLCASGWHTCAVWLRHVLDFRKREADLITFRGGRPARYGPSPGFEDIRWRKPVLAGDTLTFTIRNTRKVDLRSRPDTGLLYSESDGVNQHGEPVFAVVSKIFVERRSRLTG